MEFFAVVVEASADPLPRERIGIQTPHVFHCSGSHLHYSSGLPWHPLGSLRPKFDVASRSRPCQIPQEGLTHPDVGRVRVTLILLSPGMA